MARYTVFTAIFAGPKTVAAIDTTIDMTPEEAAPYLRSKALVPAEAVAVRSPYWAIGRAATAGFALGGHACWYGAAALGRSVAPGAPAHGGTPHDVAASSPPHSSDLRTL